MLQIKKFTPTLSSEASHSLHSTLHCPQILSSIHRISWSSLELPSGQPPSLPFSAPMPKLFALLFSHTRLTLLPQTTEISFENTWKGKKGTQTNWDVGDTLPRQMKKKSSFSHSICKSFESKKMQRWLWQQKKRTLALHSIHTIYWTLGIVFYELDRLLWFSILEIDVILCNSRGKCMYLESRKPCLAEIVQSCQGLTNVVLL